MNASVSLTFTFTQDRIIRLVIASSAFGSIYALATQTSLVPYHVTGAAIIAVAAVAITIVRTLAGPPPPGEENLDVFIDDFVIHRLPERQGNRPLRNIPRREHNNNNNIRRNPPPQQQGHPVRRNPRRGQHIIHNNNAGPHDPNGPNVVD